MSLGQQWSRRGELNLRQVCLESRGPGIGGVGGGGAWIERGKRGNNGARFVSEQSSGH